MKEVWSRGLESNFGVSHRFGPLLADVKVKYTYTRATSEAVYDPANASELYQQLPFTPKHESGTTLRVSWRKYIFSVVNNYAGKQYTDGDNNEFYAMKGYNITNLWLSKEFLLLAFSGNVMVECNNVFNRELITRPGYPLPGRNFKIGLTVKFNKTNSK